MALGSVVGKFQSHEDAEGVFNIAVEGAAVDEAEGFIKLLGGMEGCGGARFEAEAVVAAAAGIGDDLSEQIAGDALSQVSCGGTHGLDFSVFCV